VRVVGGGAIDANSPGGVIQEVAKLIFQLKNFN
jgi:hypothetical protein